MIKYYLILIIMTFMGSIASLFLKKASSAGNFISMLKNINLYIGGILYVISALLNIYLLKYLDYSIVLPMTSITYIWTLIISAKILKEKITLNKVLGVTSVIIGVIILVI